MNDFKLEVIANQLARPLVMPPSQVLQVLAALRAAGYDVVQAPQTAALATK